MESSGHLMEITLEILIEAVIMAMVAARWRPKGWKDSMVGQILLRWVMTALTVGTKCLRYISFPGCKYVMASAMGVMTVMYSAIPQLSICSCKVFWGWTHLNDKMLDWLYFCHDQGATWIHSTESSIHRDVWSSTKQVLDRSSSFGAPVILVPKALA